MKSKHLPEGEIQRLERQSEDELRLWLEKPGGRLEEFRQLLRAYRLAAKVANRAFAWMKEETAQHKADLLTALHDYAPENFQSPSHISEEQKRELIELYERAESGSIEELREAIYALISRIQ